MPGLHVLREAVRLDPHDDVSAAALGARPALPHDRAHARRGVQVTVTATGWILELQTNIREDFTITEKKALLGK